MQLLKDKTLLVDLQILDNECIKEYKATMKEKWVDEYQFFPPDVHRQNGSKRSIRIFKSCFSETLAGLAHDFPHHLWDLLLPKAELTLKLLRQATANPAKSAWEFFSGDFNYDATPLGPLGISVILPTKTSRGRSCEFCGKDR